MAAEPANAKYRPFRIAVWGVYFAVLTFFGGSIAVSVIRSVLAMTPDHQPPATTVLSTEECLAKARALWVELDQHRSGLSQQAEVRTVDADYWTKFRTDWLIRHRAAEAACAVGSPERENVKTAFAKLEQTLNLYTTHATQFAGEVGPTVDALKASLDGR